MQLLVNQINKSFEIKSNLLAEVKTDRDLLLLVASYIQELINTDFEHLLWLLYKIDVNEKKIKTALEDSNLENSSIVIAEMIIEREKEKIETRKKYSSDTGSNDWIF